MGTFAVASREKRSNMKLMLPLLGLLISLWSPINGQVWEILNGNLWGIAQQKLTREVPKVKVNLYYESFCGGCRAFITTQLGPNFQEFQKYLDVQLNPFGNAQMVKDPDTGLFNFTCQHGERECIGGMMEGCLIDKMKDQSPVPTIACIESSSDPHNPDNYKQCMDKTGVKSPTIDEVMKCAFSDEGNQLFAQLGQETMDLVPAHEYVPWILFNGEHSDIMEQEAIENLPATLCKHFLTGVPECQSVQNWKTFTSLV